MTNEWCRPSGAPEAVERLRARKTAAEAVADVPAQDAVVTGLARSCLPSRRVLRFVLKGSVGSDR